MLSDCFWNVTKMTWCNTKPYSILCLKWESSKNKTHWSDVRETSLWFVSVFTMSCLQYQSTTVLTLTSNLKPRTYTVCGLELCEIYVNVWNYLFKTNYTTPPLPWYNAPVIHHYRYFSLELVKLLSLSSIPQCLKLKIIQQTFKYWNLKTVKTIKHWPTNSGYKSMFSTRTNSINWRYQNW